MLVRVGKGVDCGVYCGGSTVGNLEWDGESLGVGVVLVG